MESNRKLFVVENERVVNKLLRDFFEGDELLLNGRSGSQGFRFGVNRMM